MSVMTTSLFSIHEVGVLYQADSQCLVDPVIELLRYFSRESLCDSHPMMIRFSAVERRAAIGLEVPAGSRLLSSAMGRAMRDGSPGHWQCRVAEDRGRLIADFAGDGCIVIDRSNRVAEGYLVQPDRMPHQMIEWYVHFTLGELVKQRGLYAMHATALEKDGQGILIPGYSGQGKTTAFLSLLRAGYRYMSDDTPWLRLNGGHVDLFAFPMKIDVTDRTIEFFPELRYAPAGVLRQGLYKKYFQAEALYPHGIGDRARPSVILFPRVVDEPLSRVEPMPKRDAFRAILPQALVVHDQDIARREFVVLSQLVQQADCFTLHFGRNILNLPELITPLLDSRSLQAVV